MTLRDRIKTILGFALPLAVPAAIAVGVVELLDVPEPESRVVPTPGHEPWIVTVLPGQPRAMLLTAALLVAVAALVVVTVSVVPPRVEA